MLPTELYLGKLAAGLQARQTPLCVVARTDSTNLDDAVQRARSFLETDAGAVIIDGLRSMDALQRVAREVPGTSVATRCAGGCRPCARRVT